MNYRTHIKSKTGLFEIDFKELLRYKDLIFLFFKRNYSTRYKQTILGPLWLVLNPLITVLLYAFVFGKIAGLATTGVPHLLFYLCSNSIWAFFATCITETAKTFTANSAIMGKVYFPRLVMPISSVLTGIMDLAIQLFMMIIAIIIYIICGTTIHFGISALLVPVLILQVAMMGLGCGIIVAALTTKYRDLIILVGFGVQLWMYASPVVYSATLIPEEYHTIYFLNPMASILTCWRSVILGVEDFPWESWGISWIVTIILLMIGVLLFNKVEKVFMDTV